jgi:hypothetical protein
MKRLKRFLWQLRIFLGKFTNLFLALLSTIIIICVTARMSMLYFHMVWLASIFNVCVYCLFEVLSKRK